MPQKFQNRRPPTPYSAQQSIHLSEIPETPAAAEDATFPEKPAYLKYAFANPYNLTVLGGALVASVLTLNPLIAVAALGVEGLWLLHGSQSRSIQRLLWDPLFAKEKEAFDQEQRMRLVNAMGETGRSRVLALMDKEKQIKQLAAQNPSFTGDLLRDELTKTSNLVNAFIDLGVNCGRYENYLRTVNIVDLQAQRGQFQKFLDANKAKPGDDDMEIQIAGKNLAVIEKRLDRINEINRYLKIAYGQLGLIENSFQLIADQIVTMQSPTELSGQLDELLDGVESIKETTKETEDILKTL